MDRVVLVRCLSDALPDADRRLLDDWPSVEPVVDETRVDIFSSDVLWGRIRSGAAELKTLIGTITEVEESDTTVDFAISDGDRVKESHCDRDAVGVPVVGARAAIRYVEDPFRPDSPLAGRVMTRVVELWLPVR